MSRNPWNLKEENKKKNTISWLFEKINKVDKPEVKLAKKKMRENINY